jgi:hypothetical protein
MVIILSSGLLIQRNALKLKILSIIPLPVAEHGEERVRICKNAILLVLSHIRIIDHMNMAIVKKIDLEIVADLHIFGTPDYEKLRL